MVSSSVRLTGAAPEALKRAALTTRCRSWGASRPREHHAALGPAQRRNAGGNDDVAAENEAGTARRDTDGGEIVRRRRDADMAHDRAVLLRQAREVEGRTRLAVDMGGHAEQRADGD